MCVHVYIRSSADFGESILQNGGKTGKLEKRTSKSVLLPTFLSEEIQVAIYSCETYEIEVSLEGTKLLGAKVFGEYNVRKLGGVINSECFARAGPRDHAGV